MLAPNESQPMQYPVFLVLERDPLIAADLAQTLQATGPCQVVAVRDPDELREALGAVAALSVAFLEMDVGAYAATWLEEALTTRGGVPVFTRGETDGDRIRARGWGLLERPFTEEMVLATLAALTGKPRE